MSATSPTPDERYVRRLIAIQAASRVSSIQRELGWELDVAMAQAIKDELLVAALKSDDQPCALLEGMEQALRIAQKVCGRDQFKSAKFWRRRRLKRSQA